MAGWPGWADAVLAGIGAPSSAGNIALLGAWLGCEGGSANFNPLNTTQPEPGATDYNSKHVKNYPDAATGLRATVTTLENGFYPGIVADLRAGNVPPAQIVSRNTAEISTWGTSPSCIAASIGLGSTPPPPVPPPPSGSGPPYPGTVGPADTPPRPSRTSGKSADQLFPFTASAFADLTRTLAYHWPHDMRRVRKARYAMVRVVR